MAFRRGVNLNGRDFARAGLGGDTVKIENDCGELSGVLCEAVRRIDIAEIAGELPAVIVLLLVTTQPKSEATEHT